MSTEGLLEKRVTSAYDLAILEALNCAGQLNMYLIRQIFIQLTKVCFANPEYFKASMAHFPEGLLDYTYSDPLIDPLNKNKPIVDIVGDYSFGDDAAAMEFFKDNQKPAIFVCLGDGQFQPYPLLQTDVTQYDEMSGATVHQIPMLQRLVFSCYSLTYSETLVLSHVLSSFLLGIRSKLNPLFLRPYTISAITAPKCVDIDNANKMYHSDIAVDLAYDSVWVNKPETVVLGEVKIDFKQG